MILANEQVAELLRAPRRADALPRPRAARPRPGRAPGRAARGARRPDAAAAEEIARSRRARRRSSSPRRAGWSPREAERRGHGRAAYTSLVLRSLKPALLQRPQPRPRRARQPRLRALHLADPPLPRPDRPPRAALDARRRRGRARARPRSARPAARCSEREREAMRIERDADERLRRVPARARAVRGRPGRMRSRARSPGVIGAGAFVRFGGELADVYEGFLPGAADARRALRPQRDRDRARRRGAAARRIRLGDPVDACASTASRRRAGASTWSPAGEVGRR